MKRIELQIFDFNELDDDAKEKALNVCRMFNVDFDGWWEGTYSHFTEKYSKHFDIEKMYFSGFSSQGDGAMFEYSGISKKLAKKAVKHALKNVSGYKKRAILKMLDFWATGSHSGRYYHEKCCSHSIEFKVENWQEYENLDHLLELHHGEIEEYIIEKYEGLAQKLYRMLEKEYEYLTSDETVKETIEANDYGFTEDGQLWH